MIPLALAADHRQQGQVLAEAHRLVAGISDGLGAQINGSSH